MLTNHAARQARPLILTGDKNRTDMNPFEGHLEVSCAMEVPPIIIDFSRIFQ